MTASKSFASRTQGRHEPVPANKHKQTNGGDTGLDWKQHKGGVTWKGVSGIKEPGTVEGNSKLVKGSLKPGQTIRKKVTWKPGGRKPGIGK